VSPDRESSRHRAREVALQVLYALDLAGRGRAFDSPVDVEEVFGGIAANFEMPKGARAFALELVGRVAEDRASLDEVIGELARNWRVSRMAAVDRNILRLAASELKHSDIPTAVILDEAVELARHFGNDSSPGFVNGILDAVAKVVRESSP
jgi:N utilization substance protein B